MAKKPIPMPVADEPGYPSLADATERAMDRAKLGPNEHMAYIACPNAGCQSELIATVPAIRPTAYEPIQYLRCPDCGWTGSMPTSDRY